MDHLGVDKLKTIPIDLKKLNDAVDKDLNKFLIKFKKFLINLKVLTKSKYNADKQSLDKKYKILIKK